MYQYFFIYLFINYLFLILYFIFIKSSCFKKSVLIFTKNCTLSYLKRIHFKSCIVTSFGEVRGMYVFIKTLTVNIIAFENCDRKENVKVKIQNKEGIPPIQLGLVISAKQFVDGLTLSNYNIKKKSTLHLVLCICKDLHFFV